MIEPEFIASLEAITALETPQILLEWVFGSPETPITDGVPWYWDNLYIRRSKFKYPESITDGDEVLTESETESPSTNYADITDLDGLRSYYYSLFLSYKEHSSSNVGIQSEIGRIGSKFYSVASDREEVATTGTDGSTVGSTAFSSLGSTFLTSGVEAGYILVIEDGTVDDGEYLINSVDSETDLTLNTTLTLTASNVDFYIRSNDRRFWVSGIDYQNNKVIWKYNANSSLVEFKIDLSEILNQNEKPLSVSFADKIDGESSNSVSIVTNQRFIRLPYDNDSPEETDIVNQWELTSLTDGYEIAGSFLDPAIYNGSNTIYILDSHHKEIKLFLESNGSLQGTLDLSNLPEVDSYTLKGLCANYTDGEIYIGNNSYAFVVNYTVTSPLAISDIERIINVKNLLISDFCSYTEALDASYSGGEYDEFDYDEGNYDDVGNVIPGSYLATVNDESDQLYSFQNLASFYLWQQPAIPDLNSIGLYHLNEETGDPQDSSGFSNHGTNNGMTQNTDAYFDKGFLAASTVGYIDFTSIASDFSGDEGTVSLWFKATDSSDLITGTHNLFTARVDANNYIRIGIVSGQVHFEYTAGSTVKTIVDDHPVASDLLRLARFHNYAMSWSSGNDEFKAYIDGEQFGSTVGSLGAWTGTPATVTVGYNATAGYDAALGVYDDVHISKVAQTFSNVVTTYTSANKMHAHSGRDYIETYESTDPKGFFYRDELFTEKFMGGSFLIRNDYDKQKLHPPNNTMTNSEIIFRGPDPLPELGHLGRLTRLVGLMLDRIADDRELLLEMNNLKLSDVDFFEEVADSIGLKGLDTINWNVDKQRRFMRIMGTIFKQAGRIESYENYARFLGFFIVMNTVIPRRKFDSVIYSNIDPYIESIPFDTMGSFDTFHEGYPLALLRFTPYIQSTKSTCTTSVASSRLLTDSLANFTSTCNVGNLIRIPSINDDAGDYYVEEIHSNTVLKVNKDWESGSNSNVTYYNCWKVTQYDQYTDELITRFLDISPDSMSLIHVDASTYKG